MLNCKPKAIPCELGTNKASTGNESEFENANLYREIVGRLIYLMTCTRPDLCYVVIYLSRHLSKPMTSQVLRYLQGTRDRCLKFVMGTQLKLQRYTDSDSAMSDE